MPNWVQSFPKVDKAGTSLVWGLRCGRNKTMLRFGSINSVFMSSGKLVTGNSLLWDRYNVSRRLEIVFIFSKLVSQIIFQIQFGLSYQREIHHKNKWNVIQSLRHIFFQKTWYRGNHITHSVAPPKSGESYCVIKRTGRWNLLKLLQYMLSGMIFKICKLRNSVGQMKEKTYFFHFR